MLALMVASCALVGVVFVGGDFAGLFLSGELGGELRDLGLGLGDDLARARRAATRRARATTAARTTRGVDRVVPRRRTRIMKPA